MSDEDYFQHSLLKKGKLEKRLYQETILHTTINSNSLVVVPTGMGKTISAVLLAAHRLDKKGGKTLFLAPTRPLVEQHKRFFNDFLEIAEGDMKVLTGKIRPKKREKEYKNGMCFFATPQVVQNDVISGKINLEEFSLVIFDECHRATGDYPYAFIAEMYMKRCENPRVLGITASPGGSEEEIRGVMENLYIDEVEIRTEEDEDVKPYVESVEKEWKKVDLPDEFKKVQKLLKEAYNKRIKKLRNWDQAPKSGDIHRKDLLKIQGRLRKKISEGEEDNLLYAGLSKTSEAMKIEHALMLLETQGSSSLYQYFKRLRGEAKEGKTKAAKKVMKDGKIATAFRKTSSLLDKDMEHPKLDELEEIVKEQFGEDEDSKLIVFSHYRDQVDKIKERLGEMEDCDPVAFIGQAGDEGLSQKEQVEILEDLEEGEYNALIATSLHPNETIILKSPKGEILVKEIRNFVDSFLEGKGPCSKKIQHGWEVFTTDGKGTFFSPLTEVHRHRRQNKVLESSLNSCGSFLVTENHSIFSFNSSGEHTPATPEENRFTNLAIKAPMSEEKEEMDLAKILHRGLPEDKKNKFYLTFQSLDQARIREIKSERKFLQCLNEESWIKKISDNSGLDPSTVQNVRERLEKNEYINSNLEGRKRIITLTKQGEKYREFLKWLSSEEKYYKGKYRVSLKSVSESPQYFREFCDLEIEKAYGKSSIPRFLKIDEELGKFLGYFVSEGSVRNNKKGGELLLTSRQGGEIKEGMKKSIEKGLGMKAKSDSQGIFIYSRLVYYLIRYVFKCGTSTKDKRIPPIIFSAPKEVKISFLKAYFEGDGYSRKDRIVFTTISRKLATGLNFLLRQLGIRKLSIRKEERQKENERDIYRIVSFESLSFKEVEKKSGKSTYYDLIPRALHDEDLYGKCKNKYEKLSGNKSCREVKRPEQKSTFDYVKNNKELDDQPKYVYDLSVRDTQRFFGGTGLACLHNSVGEEGLDIPAVDLVVFYEPVPSEIRAIQRRGRTGRQKSGKVIVLMAKDTRDEAYYWKSKHRERRMKETLKDMKSDKEDQKGLGEFSEK